MGMRGIRIQTISRELQGERIDVVEWSDDPETLITNALSLPSVMCVTVDESNPGGRTASVVVMDDQLARHRTFRAKRSPRGKVDELAH